MAFVVVLVATLLPGHQQGPLGGWPLCISCGLCVLCGARGTADFISNVILFTPLGLALAARGYGVTRISLLGFSLSMAVEVAQYALVPGRDAALGDVLANTLGVVVGWGMLRLIRHRSAHGARSVVPACLAWLAALAVAAAGPLLFRPAFPDAPLYLQWTARFGGMEHYEGRVLATRIAGEVLMGPGRIQRPAAVAGPLARGEPLVFELEAGPPTAGLAPVLGIFDDRQREVLLVGADAADLLLRYRSVGAAMRLDPPAFRFEDALAAVPAGSVLRLSVEVRRRAVCLQVAGRRFCRPQPGPRGTWLLLHGLRGWSQATRTLLGMAWLFGLFLPTGILAPGSRVRALLAVGTVLVLAVVPPILGIPGAFLTDMLAAAAGVGAGRLVRRFRGTDPGPVASPGR